jgi:hypothetical protein
LLGEKYEENLEHETIKTMAIFIGIHTINTKKAQTELEANLKQRFNGCQISINS